MITIHKTPNPNRWSLNPPHPMLFNANPHPTRSEMEEGHLEFASGFRGMIRLPTTQPTAIKVATVVSTVACIQEILLELEEEIPCSLKVGTELFYKS